MNGQINNSNFAGYAATPMGSFYGGNTPVPKMTQPLTKEEQAELQQKIEKFNTRLTPTDILRAKCTHRSNGESKLCENGDGTYTCTICGAVIDLKPYTQEQVNEIVREAINLLNLIKVKYYDIPVDVVAEYFQFIPYLERAPQLYALAQDNFSRYMNYNDRLNNIYSGNDYAVWSSFNSICDPYRAQAQPMMYGQGQMMPNPNMTPMMMQQNQMVYNGQGNPFYANPNYNPNMMNQPPQVNQPQTAQDPSKQNNNTNSNTVTNTVTSPISL